MADKKVVDWERAEEDYRVGLLSLREIGNLHGVTEGAIRKRAKLKGWVRDLNAKVHAKSEDLVRKDLVRSEVRSEKDLSEKAIIDSSAVALAEVKISHRKVSYRGKNLAIKLLNELESQTDSIELLEELGEFMRAEDDKGQDKRNDLYNKVIGFGGRVGHLKVLSDSMKNFVAMERDAWDLNKGDNGRESSGEINISF